MTIESVSIQYDPNNPQNVFRRGERVAGRVVLVLSRETTVDSFCVRAEGKAKVRWSEHYGGNTHVTYYSKEQFFSLENVLLQPGRDGSERLGPGRHERPFSFHIPDRDLPASFKGKHGKIYYSLKAKVTRSMRPASKTKTRFTVVSKADMSLPDLMKRQERSLVKEPSWFSSGHVHLNVHTERMGFLQGEALEVKAEIVNNSSRSVTPRFYLYEKQSFFAKKRRKLHIRNLWEEKGDPVSARTQRNVTRVMSIPALLPPSIFNCPIISLEYRLKVVLDVALSKNPLVKMPIVVLDSDAPIRSLADTDTDV